MVMGDTVQRPGGDAAVVRVHGTNKGVAVTCDVTPRYVAADPVMGTKQAVVETWRNLTAVGADPLAITDNMNFANPERPEIMGQFVGAVKAWRKPAACSTIPSSRETSRSTTRQTVSASRRRRPSAASVSCLTFAMADIALKREGDLLILIGREQASSASRSISRW